MTQLVHHGMIFVPIGYTFGAEMFDMERVKGLQPNMKEIEPAQDLVDSLLNAGDKLIIVDFSSPGCGGCRALHPKICQFAEMNPDVQFLQIKEFKDALAKHSTARCSLGPAKGLEESELLALAADKDLSFSYTKKTALAPTPNDVAEKAPLIPEPFVLVNTRAAQDSEEKTLLAAGRR